MLRLALLLHVIVSISTIDIDHFLPFGSEHEDRTIDDPTSDMTDPIFLTVRYPFFNRSYEQLRLSPHGLILFGNETIASPLTRPSPFPIEDLICVAPYWIGTDITDRSRGQIFFREISLKNGADHLSQITRLVRNAFPQLSAQRMFWAFVVTWYGIQDHGESESRNTYQTILTTNGFHAFTLFTYHQLEWSGELGHPSALIGFNAGDKINFYQLNHSLTPAVLNVIHDSNMDIPGQFVFHTSGLLNDIQCDTSTGLQISPFRGSIYGAYEVRLYGICFDQFTYHVRIDGQPMDDCRRLNSLYLVCRMPMLMDSGQLKVEVFQADNVTLIDSTDFLGHVPEDNGQLLLSNYVNLTQQIADPHNDQLVLQFQSNSITEQYLFAIIIYDYATQLSADDQTLVNRTRQRIDLGLGYLNLSAVGNLTIPYERIFSVTSDPADRVHALQISFEMKPTRGWLQSALFVGAKIFTAAASLHVAYCPAWLLVQRNPAEYIDNIPSCACQVPTDPWAEDFLGFHVDEGCDARKPVEDTCAYHKKARGCYRKKSDTTWAGAQCCYDEQGRFLEHGQQGAGTLDVISPDANSWLGRRLGMFGHFFSDFLSYWSCCRSLLISERLCQAYYDYRPAGRCEPMEAESIARHADLSLLTFNGSSFIFREQGEYTLLALPLRNDQQVQIRLASTDEPTADTHARTGIVAFAVGFLQGKRRVQFELFSSHRHVEIRIDTRLIDLPHEEFAVPLLIYEDQFLKIKRKTNGTFKVSFPGVPLRFRIHVRPTFDFFDLETLLEREKFRRLETTSVGLLGDLNGLSFPNGTRLPVNVTDESLLLEYEQSWKVPCHQSLFVYLHHRNDCQKDSLEANPIPANDQQHNEDNSNDGHCTKNSLTLDDETVVGDDHRCTHAPQHHLESLKVTIDTGEL